jgi:hypothetical protein
MVAPIILKQRFGVHRGDCARAAREHTCKCSGVHCNHQQEAQPKSAYGCGQDKRADTERSTDLPDELLVEEIGVASSKK